MILVFCLLLQIPTRAAADSAYFSGHAAEALAQYRTLLERAPRDTAVLWRASRAALAVGWLDPNQSTSVASYHIAQQYARTALAEAPTNVNAQMWLGAALGREAQVVGNINVTVPKAEEAYRIATAILGRDPDHAGAHSLLGQIHYHVAKVPWVVRVVGLRLVGKRIHFRASFDEAEQHLLRATQLDPSNILSHLELGRLYLRTGRHQLARTQLQQVLKLPRQHPPDVLFQDEAKTLLVKAN